MSATRTKSPVVDEAPATVPQTTPTGIGYGHPEYQFVQSIMEMQKSLGEIKAAIDALGKSVDTVKSKVDDLVKWKHMILGGAIAVGAIASSSIFVLNKASDYISIKSPAGQAMQAPEAPQPAALQVKKNP